MNKHKRVCVVRSNPVRPDSRVEKEAWTLQKAGYDVHILAWDRDTSTFETDTYIEISQVKIPITRLGHKATFGEGFKNIKSYLGFQFHMRKWLKTHQFDIVHACDFDTAFFSVGVVKRKQQRFVFDIFDFLYSEPKSLFQKIVKKAQYYIINNADATIICTEERKKQIVGSNPKRLTVIQNTPSNSQMGDNTFELTKNDRIKVVYVGILQDYRLLKEIVEVISETSEFELHVGGFGKYEQYFINVSKQFENINFYGSLSYDNTLALEKACDIMLAVYDPTIENHKYAAPNKFYESLMLGKPVVMVRGTGMAQVVEENNIGVLIDYTKDEFCQGLFKLKAESQNWDQMSKKMKILYESQYSWEEMSRRLLEMYGSL